MATFPHAGGAGFTRQERFRRCFPWLGLLVALFLSGCAGPELRTRDDAAITAQDLSIERALILANARQMLGTPYRYGGNTSAGVDCSGLVQMVYQAAGINTPRTARAQFDQLPRRDEARPGDLLFFGSRAKATHVGIYLGDNQMIHAPGSGRHVTTSSLDIRYWHKHYLGAAGPAP
ncbi:C40 family peptidase [Halomonas shantousis]